MCGLIMMNNLRLSEKTEPITGLDVKKSISLLYKIQPKQTLIVDQVSMIQNYLHCITPVVDFGSFFSPVGC